MAEKQTDTVRDYLLRSIEQGNASGEVRCGGAHFVYPLSDSPLPFNDADYYVRISNKRNPSNFDRREIDPNFYEKVAGCTALTAPETLYTSRNIAQPVLQIRDPHKHAIVEILHRQQGTALSEMTYEQRHELVTSIFRHGSQCLVPFMRDYIELYRHGVHADAGAGNIFVAYENGVPVFRHIDTMEGQNLFPLASNSYPQTGDVLLGCLCIANYMTYSEDGTPHDDECHQIAELFCDAFETAKEEARSNQKLGYSSVKHVHTLPLPLDAPPRALFEKLREIEAHLPFHQKR